LSLLYYFYAYALWWLYGNVKIFNTFEQENVLSNGAAVIGGPFVYSTVHTSQQDVLP